MTDRPVNASAPISEIEDQLPLRAALFESRAAAAECALAAALAAAAVLSAVAAGR